MHVDRRFQRQLIKVSHQFSEMVSNFLTLFSDETDFGIGCLANLKGSGSRNLLRFGRPAHNGILFTLQNRYLGSFDDDSLSFALFFLSLFPLIFFSFPLLSFILYLFILLSPVLPSLTQI